MSSAKFFAQSGTRRLEVKRPELPAQWAH